MSGRRWTLDEVRALGVSTNIVTAGEIFGIGRDKSRQLARRGEFPARVIKAGATYVVPVAGILAALGLDNDEGAAATAAPIVLADRAARVKAGESRASG